MIVKANGHSKTEMDPLTGLALRLTSPTDRERYAELLAYFRSLPPGDELARFVELLGLLSLLGQRIPDALAGFEQRLAKLPGEIASELESVAAIARPTGYTLHSVRSRRVRRLEREIWFWPFVLAAVMFMIGLVCGDQIERRRTAESMAAMSGKIEQLQFAVTSLPGAITQFQSTHARSTHR